ncbi:MAG: hypothetical protein M3485_08570 [Pseudomonadota bacterium]|nr:hypothetical protein [Pseudomonadota bacterium]
MALITRYSWRERRLTVNINEKGEIRMRRIPMATLALALGLGVGLSAGVQAQSIGYNVRTGDVWVDNRLGEINDYGHRYRDPFINEMNQHYGAPRPLLVELLDQRRWAPADVYYACSIGHALRVPCRDIVRDYDRNPGQGWGVLAQRRGIKPGSPAFHALKRGTVATYDRWGHPIGLDRDVRVDWSKHGAHAGKAQGQARSSGSRAAPAREARQGAGKPADARPGDSGKGKRQDKGNQHPPGKPNQGQGDKGKGDKGKGNQGKGKGRDG